MFPAIAAAAVLRKQEPQAAAWAVFRALGSGSGRVLETDAYEVLCGSWRNMTRNGARLLIERGRRTGWWAIDPLPDGSRALRLTGTRYLLHSLDVPRHRWSAAPRMVRTSAMSTTGGARAELYTAAVIDPIPLDGMPRRAPLTRDVKELVTGLSRSSQKRREKRATTKITEVWAKVEKVGTPRQRRATSYYRLGRDGHEYRRLADVRDPNHQHRGGRASSRNAAAAASRLAPVDASFEQPAEGNAPATLTRSFYRGAGEHDARRAYQRSEVGERRDVVLCWGTPAAWSWTVVEGTI